MCLEDLMLVWSFALFVALEVITSLIIYEFYENTKEASTPHWHLQQ